MRYALIIAPLAAAITALHQLAQHYVFGWVDAAGGALPVTGFFRLVEVWNPGVSFGMFNGLAYGQWLLSALALGISLALVVWLARGGTTYRAWAVGLIVGGAIGNTIDRLRYGAVADYLDFHLGAYHWPAFNITDAAIVTGVLLLVLENFLTVKQRKARNISRA